MARTDIYAEVTNTVLEALESGTKPWVKQWNNGPSNFIMPRRSTGEFYQGINILLLWIAAEKKGYFSEYWFTYKQAVALGANVTKGEKSTRVCYYGTFIPKDKKTGEKKEQPSKFLKSFNVFNADQIEGLPEEFYSKPELVVNAEIKRIRDLDIFFRYTGAAINEVGNSAFYNRSTDQVTMPPFETFKTANSYYSVLSHEVAHWTGSPNRLDRTKGKIFGDKAYAAEELVAELSAVFTMTSLGYAPDLDNSVAYIASWIKALRNDKKFIFTAASQASKATEFMFALYPLADDVEDLQEVA